MNKIWNQENYQLFKNELLQSQDKKYQEFHSRITVSDKVIGIPVPKLKQFSKDILSTDYEAFLALKKHDTYEETTIYGLVIGSSKMTFEQKLNYLDIFVTFIDNWASCDIVCASLKDFKTNQQQGYNYIEKLLKQNNPWLIRVGLVLLLNFYINDTYIQQIFQISNTINNEEYYVQMANAWLVSVCYKKYPEQTIKFLQKCNLNKFTYNKSIQKIIELKQISEEQKNILRKMKK